MGNRRTAWRGMLLAGALASGTPAGAADFQVFPVSLEAPADAPAGSVTLSNRSEEPIVLQVRVYRWTQVDGRDVLTPTRDVVASPPAATIRPGGEQLVRVVRTAPGRPISEEAYRLIIDEIPTSTQGQGVGVRLLLRQSIPVFFGSQPEATPQLVWRRIPSAEGWEIAAVNSGRRRQRISELELIDAAGVVIERRAGLVGYVLAGSEARWQVNLHDLTTVPTKLIAASDTGAVGADLNNQPAP